MSYLSNETIQKLQEFQSDALITTEFYDEVLGVGNKQQLIKVLRKYITVNDITLSKFVLYIWNEWQSIKDFNSYTKFMLDYIFRQEGVVALRKIYLHESIPQLNKYMMDEAIRNLKSNNILIDFKATTNEVVLSLHPQFKKDVFD